MWQLTGESDSNLKSNKDAQHFKVLGKDPSSCKPLKQCISQCSQILSPSLDDSLTLETGSLNICGAVTWRNDGVNGRWWEGKRTSQITEDLLTYCELSPKSIGKRERVTMVDIYKDKNKSYPGLDCRLQPWEKAHCCEAVAGCPVCLGDSGQDELPTKQCRLPDLLYFIILLSIVEISKVDRRKELGSEVWLCHLLL